LQGRGVSEKGISSKLDIANAALSIKLTAYRNEDDKYHHQIKRLNIY